MAKKDVVVKANKVRNWHKLGKFIRLALLILLLLLIIIYIVLKVLFNDGSFIVTLDRNDMLYSGLAMYETLNDPTPKRRLKAEELQFMDNISINWLPENITEGEGSHNGKNYIAYSFYMENQGDAVLNYWYNVFMDDVIKNADEALRIMIIINDEATVYAKGNSLNGEAEPVYYVNNKIKKKSIEKDEYTTKFRNDKDGTIILGQRKDMKAGDLDKITVVIWIEGDDPECTNALIGGHVRLHMKLIEEHTEDTIKELE